MKKFIILGVLLCALGLTFNAYAISPDTSGQLQKKVKVSSNDTTAGYLNGKLVAGGNIAFTEGSDGGNETLTLSASGDLGYSTIREEATDLTQRDTLRFIGSAMTCADDAANERTNCTLAAGSTIAIEENNVSVITDMDTIDFLGGDFDLAEAPTDEVNVALSDLVTMNVEVQTLTNKTLTTPIIGAIEDADGDDITVPDAAAADIFALLAEAQTLTNKTILSATNTVDANYIETKEINIVGLADTEVLAYDSGTGKWLNVAAGSGYTTIEDETVGLTQRTTLDFAGAGVSCADDGTNTVCTIAGAGTATITTQADDVTVDAGSDTLDFQSFFTLTEAPAGETNISIKVDSLDYTEISDTPALDVATHLTVNATEHYRIGDGTSDYRQYGLDGALTYAANAKPKRTMLFTASGAIAPAANGATKANTDGTNFSYPQASFSGTTGDTESLYWVLPFLPDSYDDGTMSCVVGWKTASVATGESVIWQINAGGRANDEVFDSALGAYAESEDSPTAGAQDFLISPAATVTTGFVAGDVGIVHLYRDADHVTDDNEVDAIFLGMKCEYSVDQESD